MFEQLSWLVLHAALGLALLGTLTSAIFLFLSILGAMKFHRAARAWKSRWAALASESLPPVSILKPIHGMEARLGENLESFFQQDYPDYEILFAADEPDDAALDVARAMSAKYPQIRCKILVTGRPPWPNPPAYSFYRMCEVAAHDILVTSDSDVHVSPHYLREVVPPLLDRGTGMLTCVYRGGNAGGFWSGLDAIGMSVEMTAGVMVANLLEGMKFGLGPTIAARKDSVEKIGGYQALGEYFSNDFVIGNLIEKAGYTIVLSHHVIEHVVPPITFRRMWERQVRWAKGTRYSRPRGHFGTGLIFAMPFGIIGLLAGWLSGHPAWGVSLLAAAVLNRIVESWVIGWGVVRDPLALRAPWLFVFRDFLGFLVWSASYLSRKAVWRDSRYELVTGGKIVLRQTPHAGE